MSKAYVFLESARKRAQYKLPWWKRFLLLFKRTYVAFDWADSPMTGYVLFYKYLFGAVYVVGEEMRDGSEVQ